MATRGFVKSNPTRSLVPHGLEIERSILRDWGAGSRERGHRHLVPDCLFCERVVGGSPIRFPFSLSAHLKRSATSARKPSMTPSSSSSTVSSVEKTRGRRRLLLPSPASRTSVSSSFSMRDDRLGDDALHRDLADSLPRSMPTNAPYAHSSPPPRTRGTPHRPHHASPRPRSPRRSARSCHGASMAHSTAARCRRTRRSPKSTLQRALCG